MKITWLGHSGFRIEIVDQILLVDPWLRGNPVFDEAGFDAAIAGTTHILVSHGHGDHSSGAPEISRATGAPVVGIYDLMTHMAATEKVETIGFNKGGTIALGEVAVTMLSAVHSSSIAGEAGPIYAGAEAGFMITGEGHSIYFSGDTDVHADMALFQDLHAPDIGILCMGGHFTMDQTRAAYACKKFFDFKAVIPCHYKTFPLLAQDASNLATAIAPTPVHELEVMGSVEF